MNDENYIKKLLDRSDNKIMTAERMQQLADNMKLQEPNMRMWQELFVYLAEREVKRLKEYESESEEEAEDYIHPYAAKSNAERGR